MQKILFVTEQKEFNEDLAMEYMIHSGQSNYELLTADSVEEADNIVKKEKPYRVVLYSDVLNKRESWNFGDAEVVFCSSSRDRIEEDAKCGLKTIGVVPEKGILDMLNKEAYMPKSKGKGQKKTPDKNEHNRHNKPSGKSEIRKQLMEEFDSSLEDDGGDDFLPEIEPQNEEDSIDDEFDYEPVKPEKAYKTESVRKPEKVQKSESTHEEKNSYQDSSRGLDTLDEDDDDDYYEGDYDSEYDEYADEPEEEEKQEEPQTPQKREEQGRRQKQDDGQKRQRPERKCVFYAGT